MPSWLKRPVAYGGRCSSVEQTLRDARLHTVCVEAKCPNRGECFGRGTATFLIMGDTCTRHCAFCGVSHGAPLLLDEEEPRRVCEAVRALGLTHAVITSVTRDDLPDGGAAHFGRTVATIKRELSGVTVEVLVPDFAGSRDAIDQVLDSGPDVFNHNIETVRRLYPIVRPQAIYERSLEVLAHAAHRGVELRVKSGIMVGLGETAQEVSSALGDMAGCGVRLLTIGQYLRPTPQNMPVADYVTPEQFALYGEKARQLGFTEASSGPFVRSSYRAEEMARRQGMAMEKNA
jgi:lipoic acid synthetase